MNILDKEIINEKIKKLIKSSKPFSIIRLRSETDILIKHLNNRICDKEGDKYKNNGGIFKPTKEILTEYSKIIKSGLEECDSLIYWKHLNNQYNDYEKIYNCDLFHNRSIEPFYFEKPWSKELEGKKILVIHPFI